MTERAHLRGEKRDARWKRALLVLAGGAAFVGVGLVVIALTDRPGVSLRPSNGALAAVSEQGIGVHLAGIEAVLAGRRVRLEDRSGLLYPAVALPAGASVEVEATAVAPSWSEWLTGGAARAETTVTTPVTVLTASVVRVRPGTRGDVSFSRPVTEVVWQDGRVHHTLKLPIPSTVVTVGSAVAAGTVDHVTVAATPEPWVRLSTPVRITYFGGRRTMALVSPRPGYARLRPSTAITLALSKPVATVFGAARPVLNPPTPGKWREPNAYTLVFDPAGPGAWPGESLTVKLPSPVVVAGSAQGRPTSTLSYTMGQGSVLRLQQVLAQLGYLPLQWQSNGAGPAPAVPAGAADRVTTAAVVSTKATRRQSALEAQAQLDYSPPAGSFTWRWKMPAQLTSLWGAGAYTVVTEGALMTFEQVEGLDPVGLSNPLLWSYLATAEVQHARDPYGYAYIDVTQSLPEQLRLWYNGRIIITTAVNTGIPQSPTADGTFPVYLRYQFQYMKGFNPNGTYYDDPVSWIAYFNGGDAVHGFLRASYGFPQSLGCVELPVAGTNPVSEQVWGYDHIGTLVTVQS